MKRPLSYRQLILLFFKIGSQAFGGWSSTVFLIENTLVAQFLSKRDLKNLVATSQVMPGPNQVLIVAQVGYRLRGKKAASLAVASYILPSMILTILFSIVYFRVSQYTNLSSYTNGLRAGVSGVIVANGYRIGKSYIQHHYWLWLLVAVAVILQWWLGPGVVIILLVYGLGGLFLGKQLRKSGHA